jgi:hypothetical protein
MITGASAGPILSEVGLVAFVLLYNEEARNLFPIQREFVGDSPQPVNSDNVVVDILESIRAIGSFDSKPTRADEVALERYSRLLAKALYQSKRYELPTNALASMRNLTELIEGGMSNSLMATDMRSSIETLMQQGVAARLVFMLRTLEDFCIKLITSTAPSFTVDGATQTLSSNPFNLIFDTVSNSWKTDSTSVLTEFEAQLTTFKKQAGGLPDVIYVPSGFYEDVIIENDQAEQFLIRNSEFLTEGIARALGLDIASRHAREKRFDVIEHFGQYTDADGDNAADMWPDEHISMIKRRNSMGRKALDSKTVRTPDNNYNGGPFAYYNDKVNPKGREAIVTRNDVPYVADRTCIRTIKYVP